MSKPDPPVDTPNTPLIYGYEADNGDTCVFPLNQLRHTSASNASPRLVTVPGAPGAVDLDGTQELEQGPLEVEVAYLITAAAGTTLYTSQSQIEQITARPGKLWRILPSGACEWTRARRLGTPRKVVAPENLGQSAWQNVTMRFTGPSGYWHGESLETGTYNYYGVPLYGSIVYGGSLPGFALTGTAVVGTIENSGDAICRALRLRLTASTAGTIAAPTVTQPAFSQSLSYSGTITNDYIELDTATPALTQGAAATDVWSGLSLGAAHEQGLLWLEPGANLITIASSGTMDGTAVFYFYPPAH
jgi:hypothetical protein